MGNLRYMSIHSCLVVQLRIWRQIRFQKICSSTSLQIKQPSLRNPFDSLDMARFLPCNSSCMQTVTLCFKAARDRRCSDIGGQRASHIPDLHRNCEKSPRPARHPRRSRLQPPDTCRCCGPRERPPGCTRAAACSPGAAGRLRREGARLAVRAGPDVSGAVIGEGRVSFVIPIWHCSK